MVLVCHAISQDHVIKVSCDFMRFLLNLMVISIVVAEMFLVVGGQDSTCSHLNPALLVISKARDIKAHAVFPRISAGVTGN